MTDDFITLVRRIRTATDLGMTRQEVAEAVAASDDDFHLAWHAAAMMTEPVDLDAIRRQRAAEPRRR